MGPENRNLVAQNHMRLNISITITANSSKQIGMADDFTDSFDVVTADYHQCKPTEGSLLMLRGKKTEEIVEFIADGDGSVVVCARMLPRGQPVFESRQGRPASQVLPTRGSRVVKTAALRTTRSYHRARRPCQVCSQCSCASVGSTIGAFTSLPGRNKTI